MNSNPLDSDPARESRIRERAYHLWEADGRPDGRETEFWERARELVGMEDSAGAGLLDNPISHPDTLTGFPLAWRRPKSRRTMASSPTA